MNFLKKLGVSCYINAVAALLILVSMFLTIASSMNVGFSIDELGYVIAFSIIAILAIVGSYFLSLKFGNKLISYLFLYQFGRLRNSRRCNYNLTIWVQTKTDQRS